ncbi:MAG: cache domain-containing protein, partial [Angelakisella sp.]
MKSIKTKILLVVCQLVAISLLLVGGTVTVLMYTSSMQSLNKTMSETAGVAAKLVFEYLETYKAVANETGLVARMSDPKISLTDKRAILKDKVELYKFEAGELYDATGKSVTGEGSIANQPYFQSAAKGTTVVSNVVLNETLNKYCVTVAAPVWKGGKSGSTVAGVVCFSLDALKLSDITNEIKVGSTGSAYLLDAENYTIAHKNPDMVTGRDNTLLAFQTDEQLASLVALETRMTAGEQGFGTYAYNGVNKILAFAPVPGGQGWSLAVNAELSEFLRSTLIAMVVTVVLVVGAILAGVIISLLLANSITKPIVAVKNAAVEMAKGNFDIELTHTSRDETGVLADSMRQMVSTTKSIIMDTA